ncbi:DNA-binding protein [Georgenia muralis]|uniref:Plasmid replication DNA-binding protein KfrA n=1 Tax=Georgenia muralis TaxID=154117 RepID=A0A3N4Z067_9MICO|nr:DNA-binding protein [Georgenia muralis]RPF26013.1 plasmid replication DNA-binding protein KfrA [Georgenia muralis]
MTTDHRPQDVEDACAALLADGRRVTFDAVAAHTGIGRATLYRRPDLRAIIEDHRSRGRHAPGLTGISTDLNHLRTALEELATKVRRHEEELRKLRRTSPATSTTPRRSRD